MARNHTGKGVRVSWKIVPAVTEVWYPHPAHSLRLRTGHAFPDPQWAQRKPIGQRSRAKYARHASSRHRRRDFALPALLGIEVFGRCGGHGFIHGFSCRYQLLDALPNLHQHVAIGAAALYPSLLPSSDDPARDITIYNAATGAYALRVGLIWWGLGMCLAFGYFVFVYRMFRGKVRLEKECSSTGS